MVGFSNVEKKVKGGGLLSTFLSIIIGGIAIFLLLSFVSYLYVGSEDCEITKNRSIYNLFSSNNNVKNYCGLLGAKVAYIFMLKGIGVCSFIFVFFLFFLYFKILRTGFVANVSIPNVILLCILSILSLSLLLWYFYSVCDFNWLKFCIGHMNLTLGEMFSKYLGRATPFFILFFFLTTLSLVFEVNIFYKILLFGAYILRRFFYLLWSCVRGVKNIFFFRKNESSRGFGCSSVHDSHKKSELTDGALNNLFGSRIKTSSDIASSIGSLSVLDNVDIRKYMKPNIELLADYPETLQKTEEEQKEIVSKIIKNFSAFKISVDYVKANSGPVMDIYEFRVLDDSKVSNIRSLEDNLCLSLSAAQVTIMAPIPGKGTIGVGVFNNVRGTLSLKEVLSSSAVKAEMSSYSLPIILGRDMFNVDKVVDLAKLPHMIVAGATGQGKSVGLNVIIASLLFSKFPDEVKFILIDPKKVEFSLFEGISDKFFVTLNNNRGVITDLEKCQDVFALLCREMDMRYDILKENLVRNIKEYNLLPNVKKMQYIVVVIDEFADLILSFREKIEKDIVRLSQLSRAVGIHMIIATQHPTVDVITGLIKANFPARIAYKVASHTDSFTILGSGGAEALLGNGDALVNINSAKERVQMPYVSTEEIKNLCDYIQQQK